MTINSQNCQLIIVDIKYKEGIVTTKITKQLLTILPSDLNIVMK